LTDIPIQPEGGYDAAYFAKLAAVEDRHFWFMSRNQVIGQVTRSLVNDLPGGYRMLEMGCGTGNVLRELEKVCDRGTVIGADLFDEGLAIAQQRVSCALVRSDIRQFAFDRPFDLVGIFDVLEHIADDAAVLDDLYRAIKPGGALLVTVPAHMALWSYFDEAAKHCRRYEPAELRTRLTEAGFEIEYLTSYMTAIAPLMWLGRKCSSRGKANDAQRVERELRVRPGINGLLKALLAMERPMIRWRQRLPFGSALLAIARRPVSNEHTTTR